MRNKSAIYGYYGGVSDSNHYVPPPSTPFTPQPASVPFYENQASAVTLLTSAKDTRDFFEQNKGSIMRRKFVGIANNQEVYEINTDDNPDDLIIYTTPISSVNLLDVNIMDGGFF